MYKIKLITKEDIALKRGPVTYEDVRTVSVTSSRVIITDNNNHMYTVRPGSINALIIEPTEEVI